MIMLDALAPQIVKTTDTPWGVIVTALVVLAIAVLYFILVIVGKAPGIKVKGKNGELDIGKTGQDKGALPEEPAFIERRKEPAIQIEVSEGIDRLIASYAKVEKHIMGTQIRAARDFEDMFMDTFQVGILPRSLIPFWDRFLAVCFLSAVENNVLGQLDDFGMLELSYITDKLSLLEADHRRLSRIYDLPEWITLRNGMKEMVETVLNRYVVIAKDHWQDYRAQAENMAKVAASHPTAVQRIMKHLDTLEV